LSTNVLNDAILDSLVHWGFLRVYRHRRTHGNLYEMYQYTGNRRYLVGFIVKENHEVDDDLDYNDDE
jgi:hypothetical protein